MTNSLANAVTKLTLDDVKAAIVTANKRTDAEALRKVVMQYGGKARTSEGGHGPRGARLAVS